MNESTASDRDCRIHIDEVPAIAIARSHHCCRAKPEGNDAKGSRQSVFTG
jgi:hypothetical protein